jgi:hypothetical protein
MKEELIKAAEKALEQDDLWFRSSVLPSKHLEAINGVFTDDDFTAQEPKGDSAAWFLLLCAEALES